MSAERARIVAVGAGRMGRGIAHMFAYAGIPVALLDLKPRDEAALAKLKAAALAEIKENLALLATVNVLDEAHIAPILGRITVHGAEEAGEVLKGAAFILEGVPETTEAKTHAFSTVSRHAPDDAIVTSTTSTKQVTELQDLISNPQRFMNTHFLNPAFLIPLVELSAGPQTAPETVEKVRELFTSVGKVPVECAPTAGYIVPRLQSLIMAEACRMIEQGVATAEDIDKAIMNGFGPRYATMGVLEFVDWGGVDILYYAGHYLADTLNSPAHAPPETVSTMMEQGKRGLREGQGYYDYRSMDVQAFQNEKLTRFVKLLDSLGQIPAAHDAEGQS